MRSPIIHDGKPFDWKVGHEAMRHVQRDDGSINWAAAMSADPGVMKCQGCREWLWREGRIVECPKCGFAWNTEHLDTIREQENERRAFACLLIQHGPVEVASAALWKLRDFRIVTANTPGAIRYSALRTPSKEDDRGR